MRTFNLVAAIVVGFLLLAILGAGLLVLAAYGIGWALTQFLPFSIFEASLLSLIALLGVAIAALRIGTAIANFLVATSNDEEEDLEDEWEEEGEWEDDEDLEDEDSSPAPARPATSNFVPGIPRWRQSPRPDFSQARRNDPCPCGSGKKFKNCHGAAANRT